MYVTRRIRNTVPCTFFPNESQGCPKSGLLSNFSFEVLSVTIVIDISSPLATQIGVVQLFAGLTGFRGHWGRRHGCCLILISRAISESTSLVLGNHRWLKQKAGLGLGVGRVGFKFGLCL